MNQNGEFDQYSKMNSDVRSHAERTLRKSSLNPTLLQKSNIGASEPTGVPSGDLSSTYSVRPNALQFRQPISIGFKKNKVVPDSRDNSRKRYFSIFDAMEKTDEDGILQPEGTPAKNQDASKEADGRTDNPKSLIKTMTYQGAKKSKASRLSTKPPLMHLNQNSMGDDLSVMESQIEEQDAAEEIQSRSKYSEQMAPAIKQFDLGKTGYLDTEQSVVDRYQKPSLLRVNPRSELKDMISKVSRKIVVRSISAQKKDLRSHSIEVKEGSRLDERALRPPSLKLASKSFNDQPEDGDWEVSADSPSYPTRQFGGHISPIKHSVLARQRLEAQREQPDLPLNPQSDLTPSPKKQSRKLIVLNQASKSISKREEAQEQASSKSRESRLGPNQEPDLGTGSKKPPKSQTVVAKSKVSNIPSLISLESDMVGLSPSRGSSEFYTPEIKTSTLNLDEQAFTDSIKKSFKEVAEFNSKFSEAKGETASEKANASKNPDIKRSQLPTKEALTGRLGSFAERDLERLSRSRNEFQEPQSMALSRPYSEAQTPSAKKKSQDYNFSATNDVFSPSFPIEKFRFLIFSNSNKNPRELKKFIKEVKSDVDAVKQISCKEPCPQKVALTNVDKSSPCSPDKRILFLDLDETLIHTTFAGEEQKVSDRHQPSVNYRPYLDLFLEEMSKYYNLVLFTASYREYAEKLLNKIDKNSEFILNVLARENCTKYNNNFIKDFRIVLNKNFAREDMVMLDNKVISFAYNMHQGIPILPYYDDDTDTELRDIIPYLIELSSKKVVLKDTLKVRYNYNMFGNLTFSSTAN